MKKMSQLNGAIRKRPFEQHNIAHNFILLSVLHNALFQDIGRLPTNQKLYFAFLYLDKILLHFLIN